MFIEELRLVQKTTEAQDVKFVVDGQKLGIANIG